MSGVLHFISRGWPEYPRAAERGRLAAGVGMLGGVLETKSATKEKNRGEDLFARRSGQE